MSSPLCIPHCLGKAGTRTYWSLSKYLHVIFSGYQTCKEIHFVPLSGYPYYYLNSIYQQDPGWCCWNFISEVRDLDQHNFSKEALHLHLLPLALPVLENQVSTYKEMLKKISYINILGYIPAVCCFHVCSSWWLSGYDRRPPHWKEMYCTWARGKGFEPWSGWS